MKFKEGQQVLVDIQLNGQTKTEQATVLKVSGKQCTIKIGARTLGPIFASQIRKDK